jgi:chemotaxis protein methyltransferase CheR
MSATAPRAGAKPMEASLSTEDFNAIAAMLRDIAGITLGPNKRDLVFGRLNRRLRALGLQDFTQYRHYLDGPDGADEVREMINALTTNLTSFFREGHHFDCLANQALPWAMANNPNRRLRLWSAACSSGEEPYSIAMVLARALSGKGAWDARILATDIDTNMVATAQAGCYDADRAGTIPEVFSRQIKRRADGRIDMPDSLKASITFNPLNLLGEWPMRGPFDIVFCRNVVIYFEKDVQRVLFGRIADLMPAGGWLFIGHSESLLGVSDRFEGLGRTIYRKLP